MEHIIDAPFEQNESAYHYGGCKVIYLIAIIMGGSITTNVESGKDRSCKTKVCLVHSFV